MSVVASDETLDAIPEGPVKVSADNREELKTEALNRVQQARSLQNRADGEKRELASDEAEQFDRLVNRAQDIDQAIERFEARERLNAVGDRLAGTGERRTRPTANPEERATASELRVKRVAEARDRMFDTYMRYGEKGVYTAEMQTLMAEQRDLAVGLGSTGGYLSAPEAFVARVIKNVDDMVFLWDMAEKFPVDINQSVGAPTLETDPSDGEWTSEISVGLGSPDSTMSFGKRRLTPRPLAKAIKVSNDLLQVRNYDAGGFVAQRIAYKLAVPLEKKMLTGTGANEPLGVFTASADGVDTSRDFAGDNTTTALKTDSLLEAIFGLKQPYLDDPSTSWIFSRTAMLQLHKLKDGTGNYLVQPNLVERRGLTIRGYPVKLSEFCPSTFTTGQYVGALGAWRNIWGAYVGSLAIQRLVELYAASNQTAFFARAHFDAQPVIAEAFSRIVLA